MYLAGETLLTASLAQSLNSEPRSEMAAAHRPRVLFLHTTALSDAEYTAYFDALHDIMDEPDQAGGPVNTKSIDENLEAHEIGIREARAWMRGRFRDMGNLSNVDKVCLIQFGKLVCLTELYGVLVVVRQVLGMLTPSAQNRCISAGQFFAALRLLMHARNGSDVSDAMLFIQGEPLGIGLLRRRLDGRSSGLERRPPALNLLASTPFYLPNVTDYHQ